MWKEKNNELRHTQKQTKRLSALFQKTKRRRSLISKYSTCKNRHKYKYYLCIESSDVPVGYRRPNILQVLSITFRQSRTHQVFITRHKAVLSVTDTGWNAPDIALRWDPPSSDRNDIVNIINCVMTSNLAITAHEVTYRDRTRVVTKT